MSPLRPLITICGTTGVGKSKLAIELALKLSQPGAPGARIINADAMQAYAGLDTLTNKVTPAERQGIPHALLAIKQPGDQYVVGQWVHDAVKEIADTHAQGAIPIVVGGTAYWIQHLVFPNRLVSDTPTAADSAVLQSVATLQPYLRELFNALPEHPPSADTDAVGASALHALLTALDPAMAARWHWRDTRKVLRNLSIIRETGHRPSDIVEAQSRIPTRPRYRTLCFWLYADPEALFPRLDARVDEMIERGLLDEVRTLNNIAHPAGPASELHGAEEGEKDYTLGIYQAIGYREFQQYLASPTEQAFRDAVEAMKVSTRNYAKRQIKWIRNKLLPAAAAVNAEELVVPAYLLDASRLGEHWNSEVRDHAEQITQDFLAGNELPDSLALSPAAREMLSIATRPTGPAAVLRARRQIVCATCTTDPTQPFMVDEGEQWVAHRGSRTHRRRAKKTELRAGATSALD